MKWTLGLIMGLVMLAVSQPTQAQQVRIVLPDDAVESVHYAAEELTDYLTKVTQAQVQTVPLSQWSAGDGSAIVLGIAPKGQAPIEQRDSYRLLSQEGTLYLYGYDQPGDTFRSPASKGTLFAVYDYLKNTYGVDWIHPGPGGEILPDETQALVVDGFDRFESPAFEQRVMNVGVWVGTYMDIKQRLGLTEQDDRAWDRREREWVLRQRLSVTRFVEASHAFTRWWERYSESNPEYFALHRTGKRELHGAERRVKLCTSNPDVVTAAVASGLEVVERNPLYVSISGSPNDSAFSNWCSCDACEALDHPDGRVYTFNDAAGSYEHVSMSDRMVAFWNAMARELEQIRPDLKVAGYAYYSTSEPPLREKLHPNILIGFVQQAASYWDQTTWESERAKFDGWADRDGKGYWRPNALLIGHGVPSHFISRLADDIRHIHSRDTRYVFYDSMHPYWGTRGQIYYVLAQLLWDAQADAQTIFDNYLNKAYGPAASYIAQYYQRLEDVTEQVYHSGLVDSGLWRVSAEFAVATFYDDELLAALQADLDQALAAADRQDVRARVELLREGLAYSKLQIAVFRKLYLGDENTQLTDEDVVAAIQARNNWLIANAHSLAIATPAALRIGEITDRIALRLRNRLGLDHLRGE